MAKGQMIVALDFSGIAEDEFHDWFDTEHMPERERVPGFLSCRRWIGVQNPKEAVHLFDLDSLAVLESPAYRAISGDNVSIWSKRIRAKCRRLIRFEGEQILPGDALAPAEAGGLLVVGMTPPPAVETEFNAWYDTEHVPAAGPRAGRVVRAPAQECRRRAEIRRALSSDDAGGHRERGMERGQCIDADAGTHPAADRRPHPLCLPSLRAQSLILVPIDKERRAGRAQA
jgi:hypothetical protein